MTWLRWVPWWAWPLAALLGWGGWEHHRAERMQGQLDEAASQQRAAAEVGRYLARSAQLSKEQRNAEDQRTIARLDADVRELRKRPDRLPAAALAACAGSTGAELGGRDAEFLARFAADAERQQSELAEWRRWGASLPAACLVATPAGS